MITNNHSDLDMSDVEVDALNDPTLNRDCEEGAECLDPRCPLIHPGDFDTYYDLNEA